MHLRFIISIIYVLCIGNSYIWCVGFIRFSFHVILVYIHLMYTKKKIVTM